MQLGNHCTHGETGDLPPAGSDAFRSGVDWLARRILTNINSHAVVTPVNLVATVLLGTPKHAMLERQIGESLRALAIMSRVAGLRDTLTRLPAIGSALARADAPLIASLAQALARVGGMNDMRADAEGLFIFRYEEPGALNWAEPPIPGPDGKVPVVYQVNLRDPSSFFVAQNFPIADRDVVFVANSAAADLQKFLNIVVGAVVYPALTVVNATR